VQMRISYVEVFCEESENCMQPFSQGSSTTGCRYKCLKSSWSIYSAWMVEVIRNRGNTVSLWLV
jgi:hypothetical protein